MFTPYPHQLNCLEALRAHKGAGNTQALVVMATGLGKTVTAAFATRDWLEEEDGRVLYLCHQNDILYQARTTFEAVLGHNYSYGFFHGEEKSWHEVKCLFGSFQTMQNCRELFSRDEFKYIIVDETHHSHAETFKEVIEYFRPDFLMGITATPDRGDGQDIRDFYGNEVFSIPLPNALAEGLLAPVDYRLQTDEIMTNGHLETPIGKMSIKELNRKIFVPKRDDEIARIIAQNIAEFEEPRTIIFCSSVKHCDHLVEFIPDAMTIHSRVPSKERALRTELFRQGVISTVLTVDCFNEGIDIPEANVIVFVRSTASPTIFLQQLGRGLRKSDGKTKVIVLDFVANCDRIKMIYDVWKQVAEHRERWHEPFAPRDPHGGNTTDSPFPMLVDVPEVKFTEIAIQVLDIIQKIENKDYIRKVSEIEHLRKEYSPGNSIPVECAIAGARTRYLWTCSKCKHEWRAPGARRVGGSGCPACAGQVVGLHNSLASRYPELAKEYSPRNPLPADKIIAGTNRKLWWTCKKCGYEWEMQGNNRVHLKQNCPSCSHRRVTEKNNMTVTHPQLAEEYSPRNPLPADKILAGTNRKLWWTCKKCGHEWETNGNARVRGNGCPSCANWHGLFTREKSESKA